MFKSKNTKLKLQSTTLKIIVIPHQENTNISVFPGGGGGGGGHCPRPP